MRYLYSAPYNNVVSDIAIFVLKRDVKLQLTNLTIMDSSAEHVKS